MFRRCPKAFHNNYNCINHTGVIIANILSEAPSARNHHIHRNHPTNLHLQICKLVNKQYYRNIVTNIDNNTVTTRTHMLVLPYKGEKGETLIKSLNKHVKKVLLVNHLSQHAYSSKNLGSFFNIKDQTKLEHNNDVTYLVKCPERTCSENYLGKTARRINKRLEHVGKDKKSHMLQHTLQSGHPSVLLNEFKTLGNGFNNNREKRKISESLLIKQYRPTLNNQENSISLELFN